MYINIKLCNDNNFNFICRFFYVNELKTHHTVAMFKLYLSIGKQLTQCNSFHYTFLQFTLLFL